MDDWYSKVERGWLIRVHVQPGAKTNEVVGLHGGALKIRIASPPVEGRANEALIAFVATALQLPRALVSLQHGAGSRRKSLLIASPGADPARLMA